VTVTASKSFSTVVGRIPGVPNPITVTRSATLRVGG
jgi:hypothetical protein